METIHLINAQLVTPLEVISGTLVILGNKIDRIIRSEEYDEEAYTAKKVDLAGAYVLPGIIDIHTDAIENEIMPRSKADFPIEVAFRELEKKMSACGITTVYHSMHLGYQKAEKHANSKFDRREIFERVYACLNKPSAIRNKIHLRYELSGVYHYELVREFLEKEYVELFSIMDHTPGQGQYSMEEVMKRFKREGKTEEEIIAMVEEERAKPMIKGEELAQLLAIAKEKNIAIASHDDDTIEKVEEMHRLGITICEFPITLEAAEKALALGMHTIGGGANVLRGGSTSGNMNVQEAIQKGLITALCSDYYPSSIVYSIFKLVDEGVLTLPQAVNVASLNPAKAVNQDHLIGSITQGKLADLIVVKLVDGLPQITSTIVNGKEVFVGNLAVNEKELVCQ